MKTKLLFLIASLFMAQAVMAQFHIGVKGGANITKIDGKSFEDEFRLWISSWRICRNRIWWQNGDTTRSIV